MYFRILNGRAGVLSAIVAFGLGFGCVGAKAAPVAGIPPAPLLAPGVPEVVGSGQAHVVSPMSTGLSLNLAIGLTLRNTSDLDALLAQLQNPTSPAYRQYLSVDQFTAMFAPSRSDYDTVVSWATANGLTVTDMPRNRLILDVRGSVAAINRALHVTMMNYQDPAQARTFFAPDREPTVALSVPILQIAGLNDYSAPQSRLLRGTAQQVAAAVAHGGTGPGGEFLPSDMRLAYYGNGPLTGAGQTVGIFSYDGYKPADVQLYFSQTGMSSNIPVNNVLVNGYSGLCDDGGANCDDGEQVLDIVNVMGMAPGLDQILFYEGSSGPDILNRMASDNIAKVLSCSWGSSDLGTANDPIFQEFAAQGQTFINATGDNGAYNAQTWLPPSLNSLALQVGGTDLTTSSNGAWQRETAWSHSSGGYYQPAGYSIPTYQATPSSIINTSNKGSTQYRNDPDVAAEANFDNPTVSNGQFQTGYGGTSFAAPRWAGYLALANEQAQANSVSALGMVNTALYAAASANNYAKYATNFHDITSGSNPPSSGPGTGFNAVPKYDLVTGWGSPNGAALIGSLAGGVTAPGYVLGATPVAPTMTASATSTVNVTVNPLNGFTGVVALTASGLPSGVTAAFNPASTASGASVLTFSGNGTTSPGTYPIVVTGTSGSKTQNKTLQLLVGNPPSASVSPGNLTFAGVVPQGNQSQNLTIADATNSLPLNYSVNAFASSGGSCSGSVAWLAVVTGASAINNGQSAGAVVTVTPATASLAPGNYAAEICFTTNDPANATIAVEVAMTVIPGPASDSIFLDGFESGQTGVDPNDNLVLFNVNQPAEASQAGSSLDFYTGNYHAFSSYMLDNLNLYADPSNAGVLSVYWYNDVLQQHGSALATEVGGVTSGGQYALLMRGATVGPASTFSQSISALANWQNGADGYLGVAFVNEHTNALNYGYLHIRSTGPEGFPAQALDYGYNNAGHAVRIP